MHEKYSQADNSTLARWQWNITVSSNTLECMTVNSAIGYSSSKRKVRWRCTVICGYNNVQCSLVSLNLIVWLGGVLRNSRGCVDAVWLGDEKVDRSLWCIYEIYALQGIYLDLWIVYSGLNQLIKYVTTSHERMFPPVIGQKYLGKTNKSK